MSKTYKQDIGKDSTIFQSLEKGYTGYLGEGIWRRKARAWARRLVHKANRRYAVSYIRKEISNLEHTAQ